MVPDDSKTPPTEKDRRVLKPEELDITREENVVEIDDGRYVIGTSGRPNLPTDSTSVVEETDIESLERDEIDAYLRSSLEATTERYAFDMSAKFDGVVTHREIESDDVVETFELLVRWFAENVGDGTEVEDVLGILLAEADLPVAYPTNAIRSHVEAHGLTPDDSIGALFDALQDEK